MRKDKLNIWCIFSVLSLIFLMTHCGHADSSHSTQKALQCQTVLEKFCLRLESRSKEHATQMYYKSLYRQAQDLLTSLKTMPREFNRCENFIKVVEDILGQHPQDLEPLPSEKFLQPATTRLARPIVVMPGKPLHRGKIHYVYDRKAGSLKGPQRSGEAVYEDEKELQFAPFSRLSRAKGVLAASAKEAEKY